MLYRLCFLQLRGSAREIKVRHGLGHGHSISENGLEGWRLRKRGVKITSSMPEDTTEAIRRSVSSSVQLAWSRGWFPAIVANEMPQVRHRRMERHHPLAILWPSPLAIPAIRSHPQAQAEGAVEGKRKEDKYARR